ncbi:hypothetical protein [Ralstonia pseudosolanacearum]|uniref:hypothetical protein n=1 Tax=Ralstonia pseudosolanacearum TaxID=1310165 RepID=UPI00399D5A40
MRGAVVNRGGTLAAVGDVTLKVGSLDNTRACSARRRPACIWTARAMSSMRVAS